MAERSIAGPGAGAESSSVSWPAGPHYFDLTGSEGAVAWVRYRVWAADWYTRTLESVAGPDGNFDRLVGVEMALEGVLNSLSSAFDAGTALVINGAETALDLDEPDRLPVHQYSWAKACALLRKPGVGADPGGASHDAVSRVIRDVEKALAGERDSVPTGWLAELRRFRNHVAHQDTLARHHDADGSSRVSGFGSRKADTFTYLASACDQVHDLTEQMVSLAIHLGAHEVHAGWERPRWFPQNDEP